MIHKGKKSAFNYFPFSCQLRRNFERKRSQNGNKKETSNIIFTYFHVQIRHFGWSKRNISLFVECVEANWMCALDEKSHSQCTLFAWAFCALHRKFVYGNDIVMPATERNTCRKCAVAQWSWCERVFHIFRFVGSANRFNYSRFRRIFIVSSRQVYRTKRNTHTWPCIVFTSALRACK